jgi:prepilin-type N-terminal cleavage/methylation domain-containing protein
MRTRARQRGFTLIENMAAMAVVLIGATGLASMFSVGVRMNGDARRMTRATAIAQDLVDNIALWPYQDNVAGTPLANTKTANDGDIGDTAFAFERTADPLGAGLADHGEADIAALGTAWTGIPASEITGQFERYWNVAYVDTNGDGTNDVVQIAVVVRWQQGGSWRRIVLLSAKINPVGRS